MVVGRKLGVSYLVLLVSVSAQLRPLRSHDARTFVIVIVPTTSASSAPVVGVRPESRKLPIRHFLVEVEILHWAGNVVCTVHTHTHWASSI